MSRALAANTKTRLPSSPGTLEELKAAWPLPAFDPGNGYRERPAETSQLVDALALTPSGHLAVGVLLSDEGTTTGRPVIRDGASWRFAVGGDGATAALLSLPAHRSYAEASGPFELELHALPAAGPGRERPLAADQSNLSVVVDDAAIVKWRTATDADGVRGLTLRHHLSAAGFDGVPTLLGALTWTGPAGTVVIADIDAYLPGATDGWDRCIELLEAYVVAGPGVRQEPLLGRDFGALTAGLHVALARPSAVIPVPVDEATEATIRGWHTEALVALERATAIDAEDRDVVAGAAPRLRAAIDGLSSLTTTPLQPLHGDLHIGQLVAWDRGWAIIDFDGPPQRPRDELDLQPVARDVAQLLCSLEMLAVVVDRRTGSRYTSLLHEWSRRATSGFLAVYRDRVSDAATGPILDERLLEPAMAEQWCRELIYADEVLPRWRYAPLGALRWRAMEDRR